MAPHDPKLNAVFDAIREALARVADEEIIPRLESIERERGEDFSAALGQAIDEERGSWHQAVVSAVGEARAELETRHAALAERLQAESETRASAQRLAETAAVEARAHVESLTSQVQYLQSRLSDLDQMWRVAAAERDAFAVQSSAGLLRLVASLRHFRSCSTLTQCLDALGSALAEVTPRGAVLLPRGHAWLLWSSSGFAADDRITNKMALTAPLPTSVFTEAFAGEERTSGGVGAHVEGDTRAPLVVATKISRDGLDEAWPFVVPAPREDGACWPVLIEGVVTVVVYADRDALSDEADPRRETWEALVSALVTYAQKTIESATAGQLLRSAGVVVSRAGVRASA